MIYINNHTNHKLNDALLIIDVKGRAILSNNDTVQDKAVSVGKNKRKKAA